jgi:hypothetical protein
MAYENKPNSGSLWPNKRKAQPNHPDLTGTIDVDGVQFWINAWSKTAPTSGQEWLSISIKPKDTQSQPAKTYTAPAGGKWARPVAPAPLTPSEDNDDKPTDAAPDQVPF